MFLFIFFIIPIVLVLLWIFVTKSCWKIQRSEGDELEDIKFPVILYAMVGMVLLIPIINWVLGIGIWVLTANLHSDENSEEFLAALSNEEESDIVFNRLSNIFRKY